MKNKNLKIRNLVSLLFLSCASHVYSATRLLSGDSFNEKTVNGSPASFSRALPYNNQDLLLTMNNVRTGFSFQLSDLLNLFNEQSALLNSFNDNQKDHALNSKINGANAAVFEQTGLDEDALVNKLLTPLCPS